MYIKKLFFIIISIIFISKSSFAADFSISNHDKQIAEKAYYYAKKGNFTQSRYEAGKASEPLIHKIILWMQYNESYEANNYKKIADFIKQNPDWPSIKTMRNRAEDSLWSRADGAYEIASYFKDEPPVTSKAKLLLAEAKIALGSKDKEEINSLIRYSWINGDYSIKEEEDFLKKYRSHLNQDDYIKRINRLLWEEKTTIAQRIFGYINNDYKKLFQVRMLLAQDKKNADSAIQEVPKQLQDNPGLLYENAWWQMRRKHYDKAYDILKNVNEKNEYQDKWWQLRKMLIRELMDDKKFEEAYQLAISHNNDEGGIEYAESQWLAGWLALRFAKEHDKSFGFFHNLYNNVSYPISLARAAYWAARAKEAGGEKEEAAKWYKTAAQYPTTFYGQLAHMEISPDKMPDFDDDVVITQEDKNYYKNNELLKAAYILISIDQEKAAEKFIKAAVNQAKTKGQKVLIGKFGYNIGHRELSVIAAKEAAKDNIFIVEAAYPLIVGTESKYVDQNLAYGIIRQESMFNAEAASSAGALGLMQLLPSTAQNMAKHLKLKYAKSKLVKSPEFNVILGSYYLGRLVDGFDGSYILAIASYNAGASNVRKWINKIGDPTKEENIHNIVDWIELIPFSETRNYVQRVLENKQVYQYRTKKANFSLIKDLKR